MLVLDTSTLILLAKTDVLALLAQRTQLRIPEEVRAEALVDPERYDAQVIAKLLSTRAIQVSRRIPARARQRLQHDFGLGPGEAAALLVAEAERTAIGTDDGPAIKAAKVMGVPFLTAIHVLTELHEKGRLDRKTALAKLENLQKVGRYNVQILEDARDRMNT